MRSETSSSGVRNNTPQTPNVVVETNSMKPENNHNNMDTKKEGNTQLDNYLRVLYKVTGYGCQLLDRWANVLGKD